jgi:hypothetical protein
VEKRGEIPEVPATGTLGTPWEVSGVVLGIYFLEKNEQVPRYQGPNEQSLTYSTSRWQLARVGSS